ncbi:hypothetical protein KFL_006270020 [Klebsormidium nitens]|uniref:SF3 helicase domain-containing protein n=1 Tax=Klebsormidium nitens TaxID=105231 RepID=A0A1Y1IHH4_KLENI|nr:hypothetical protein KFL_006270020 [Klebsormidium nitens]|eukprot:GAQ90320.1 hypothetical protein KFL_006270020 [Klebsormidium nitens]
MHSADPHSLHCHECGTTAEYGLRGSKEGGETRYLCSAHSRFNGCFCIDKDRAVWVRGRVQRRLEAAVAWLEEELQQMEGPATSLAESASCLPVWEAANFKAALPPTKPMSHALLAILLMIGCVESNPGPSSDGVVGSADSASASFPPLSQSRPTPVGSGGGDWDVEDARMEESGGPSMEAESQGEDIEDVEFNREEESSDEETSQDRAFRNDSPQPLDHPPFCEYAAMDAELWPSETESGVQLGGPRKRVKRVGSEQSGESQPRQRRRRRVILSEAEAEAGESGSEEGGQSATSSEWGDLRNDDDPFWGWDDERESEELRQYFSVCRIHPRSGQERRESLARQAVPQHGESMAPVAATAATSAGPSVRDASMSAATSALPTRASPRAAVQETTPFRQAASKDNHQLTNSPSEDESQSSESEGEGEDIEGAEFEREEESSDEETPQGSMFDDASQDEENPVVQHGRYNAAMDIDSESEDFPQLLRRRFKRGAPEGATNLRSPLQTRRRARAMLASSESSSEEGSPPRHQSPARVEDMGRRGADPPESGAGADHPMPEAAPQTGDSVPRWLSSEPPPRPEDDGWLEGDDLGPGDVDQVGEDFVTKCVIVPRPPRGCSSSACPAVATSAAAASGLSVCEPCAPVAVRPSAHASRTAAGDLPRSPPPSPTGQAGPSSAARVPCADASPRPAAQTSPVPGAPCVDPCLATAHHFHSLGVVSMTLQIRAYKNRKGVEKKKPIGLRRDWESKCDIGNCLQSWVQPRQNCLAMSTGASDMYVVDIDSKDGGCEAFDEMLAEHGALPADTPWEWTGHRPGKHFFFSLSQSKEAGLQGVRNKGGVWYKGKKVGIDTRGERGMLFVAPSSYKGLDGTVRQYEWVQEIAPDRSNLRALPGWLIQIFNASDAHPPASAPRSSDRVARCAVRFTEDVDDPVEVAHPPATALLRRIEESVAATGDLRSRFDKRKRSPVGDMYVFRVAGERTCPYGAHHSGSNNFCVLVHGKKLLYHCSSSECCDIQPKRMIGELTLQESMLGRDSALWSGGHDCLREADEGVCGQLGLSGRQGWQPDCCPDVFGQPQALARFEGLACWTYRPGYMCTKFDDVAFRGLDLPTPTLDAFLADIFNDDRGLIDFMQRLWGYAMNGRTSEEIIVFLLGSGGNGKGVCKQMLETTLGAYYGVMSKDAVVKPPGQRAPSKGAATGYLAELQGLRVAITDETSPGERVDLGLVLTMTGGGKISSRLLYQNNVSFRFSHTPFIQTNYDPEVPPTLAIQPNVERRLVVVQFPNEYVSDDKFDESNPKHRHLDTELKERMETPAVCEEFLTFLVRGSCAWYADPSVLRRHPPAVQAAKMAWLRRGDKLQTFLQSEHCQVDPEGTPEGAQSVAWEDDFWRQFQEFAGVKMSKEELARQMRAKGYNRTKRGGRFDGVPPSQRSSCYVGLKCEYE